MYTKQPQNETLNETLTDVLTRYGAIRETEIGRPLTTNRDILDFLVSVKNNDTFWNDLQTAQPINNQTINLTNLRNTLPNTAFTPNMTDVDCLTTMGIEKNDINTILNGQLTRETITNRINDAFSAGTPRDIATALETLLVESPTRIAIQNLNTNTNSTLGRTIGTILTVCVLASMAFGSLTACYKGVTPEA